MMARMDLDTCSDDIRAKIAADLVLDAWRRLADDRTLRDDQRLAMIAGDERALTDKAAALCAITSAVAAGSAPEALVARAAAADAQKAAEVRRFRTGARAVERRVDLRKASETLDRERRALAKAEAAFERLQRSDAPDGEKLIAEGALLMQRERAEAAEAEFAAAQART